MSAPKTDLCHWRRKSDASLGAPLMPSEGRATMVNYQIGGSGAAHVCPVEAEPFVSRRLEMRGGIKEFSAEPQAFGGESADCREGRVR